MKNYPSHIKTKSQRIKFDKDCQEFSDMIDFESDSDESFELEEHPSQTFTEVDVIVDGEEMFTCVMWNNNTFDIGDGWSVDSGELVIGDGMILEDFEELLVKMESDCCPGYKYGMFTKQIQKIYRRNKLNHLESV